MNTWCKQPHWTEWYTEHAAFGSLSSIRADFYLLGNNLLSSVRGEAKAFLPHLQNASTAHRQFIYSSHFLQGSLTCCDPSPFTMWGIMATSPFSSGGSSSGIWSVIIIVTYIHGEFSSTGFLQEKHQLDTLQNPLMLSWILPIKQQTAFVTSAAQSQIPWFPIQDPVTVWTDTCNTEQTST